VDETNQGFFWPASDSKRREWQEVKRLRPNEAQSVYMCNPGSRSGDIFLADDFNWYDPPANLDLGVQHPEVAKFCRRGGMIVTGWDTALSALSSADWTVGVTGLLVPCEHYHRAEDASILGACDMHYDVYILDIVREKLDLGGAINAVRTAYMKWMPQTVVIEKRANGTPIMQALGHSGIPIEGVDPIESKRERVVNARGVGSVQGWFRLHRVLFPMFAEWLDDAVREIRDFTGERGNIDDQVDALAHMIGYAIREGGGDVRMPTDFGVPARLQQIMGMPAVVDPIDVSMRRNDHGLADYAQMGMGADPFGDRCARCENFEPKLTMCKHHRRKVSALHPACEAFESQDGLTFINWR
jgi:predicted phage terminase large subunit-like protein